MKKLLLFFLLVSVKLLQAQTYQKEFDINSAWQVKQLNEFIERFNNDSTLITKYNKQYSPSTQLTRDKLIKSLFNAQRTDWNHNEIDSFIKQVENKTSPELLDFYKDKWYASVTCSIVWNGKPENAILKLQVQKYPNGGYKWVIADVDAKFLEQVIAANGADKTPKLPPLPKPTDSTAFLNPMSHTTDFERIYEVTGNPKNISNYIVNSNEYSKDFCCFITECINNHLKITDVTAVSYVFLQIRGWKIEVEQFNRDSRNAGWLINKLSKLSS